MKESIVSLLILVGSYIVGFFILAMLLSHIYSIAIEKTTNENIKSKRNKKLKQSPNPFSKDNIFLNANAILCAPKIKGFFHLYILIIFGEFLKL